MRYIYIINLVIFVTNIVISTIDNNITAILGWTCACLWVIVAWIDVEY